MIIRLFIPGPPGAKGRARFTREGRAYTPAGTMRYETYLKALMAEHMHGNSPLDEPVELACHFVMQEPKSMPKRDRGKGLPHVKKPDLDNLEKSAMDAMNGVMITDDCLIWCKNGKKTYPSPDAPNVGVHLQLTVKGDPE